MGEEQGHDHEHKNGTAIYIIVFLILLALAAFFMPKEWLREVTRMFK